ncbi:MAG: response regulator transcription factor [Pedobacter sp.]|nr:MAG: response regulator transcription factor [Pedobacter sp.]
MIIPPGLVCENGEFFVHETEIHSIFDSARHDFENTPQEMLEALDNSITPEDLQCMTIIGISDQDDRRAQWIHCNNARLDGTPDFIPGQKYLQREFVECSLRGGQCDHEGKLCRTLEQLTKLTTRQLTVLTHVGRGLLNKEIAYKMGISLETVSTHTQNIRIKTGAARKADLVRVAQKLNLISNQ